MRISGIADAASLTLILLGAAALLLALFLANEPAAPQPADRERPGPKSPSVESPASPDVAVKLDPVILPDPPPIVPRAPSSTRAPEAPDTRKADPQRRPTRPRPATEPTRIVTPLALSDGNRAGERQVDPPDAPRRAEAPAARPQPPPPRDAEASAIEPAAREVGPEEVRRGRALLRILEHGTGPRIELAWPRDAGERERLYRRLRDCFGMRIAVVDWNGRLFRAEEAPGVPWELDLDRYSGFVRSPDGRLEREEMTVVKRIHDHHAGRVSGWPVRVFPRQVDALLLGGLQHLIGPDYARLKSIRGRYRLERARVLVDDIQADGQRYAGRIDLTPAGRTRCRAAGS